MDIINQINQVSEVPDTPDRVVARRRTGRESIRRDSDSLLHGNFRNRDKLVTEDRHHTRGPVTFQQKCYGNLENANCSDVNAPNDGLCRRPAADRSYGQRANHSSGIRNMAKGKSIGTDRSSGYQVELTNQNDYSDHRNAVSYGAPEQIVAEDKRQGQVASRGTSFGPCIPDFPEQLRSWIKGKETIDENALKSPGLAMACGEAVNMSTDSQHKGREHMPARSFRTRYPGKKNLVRNGCISPQNIAKAEQLKNTSENIEQRHAWNGDFNRPRSPVTGMSDIVAEENGRERTKGKAVLTIPDASKEQFRGFSSSLANHNGEANGLSDASRDAFGSAGWRSTRDRSRNVENTVNDTARHLSRRTGCAGSLFRRQHENGVNRRDISSRPTPGNECDHAVGQTAALRDPFVSETERSGGAPGADNAFNKRLKKFGSSSRNHGGCSTSISEDSDVMFLASSREPVNSRSSRVHHSQSRASLGPVIDVDAFSPPVRRSSPQTIDSTSNDDSEARARQVEADEILARELQEQLYHETPLARGGNIDAEFLAWVMQEEDNGSNASGAGQNESHARGSVISHLHRQPRSRTFQNRSNRTQNQPNRRWAQTRVPSSSRMAQMRGRSGRQRPAVFSSASDLHFPLGMDLDVRLDILEELEDAFGDLSAAEMGNHVLQVQHRDFNESDYEMLLMLDELNHRHAGASANQINSLPQSVVQTDNLEESCAICLEAPTTGETIRHLPCLHKFHKDCIDPWLSQKTSCPVCKSSIT